MKEIKAREQGGPSVAKPQEDVKTLLEMKGGRDIESQ